jgi:hypothetical protein
MEPGRPAWTYRCHPNYDPNQIGAISQARVAAALVEAGKMVWFPTMQVARCDLLMEDHNGFFRVQCKTGHIIRGAIRFPTYSLRAAKKETGWRRIAFDYRGQIDYFGVYCPENGLVYLVPVAETSCRGCALRISPSKNNQKNGIRWARNYEVRPLTRE